MKEEGKEEKGKKKVSEVNRRREKEKREGNGM